MEGADGTAALSPEGAGVWYAPREPGDDAGSPSPRCSTGVLLPSERSSILSEGADGAEALSPEGAGVGSAMLEGTVCAGPLPPETSRDCCAALLLNRNADAGAESPGTGDDAGTDSPGTADAGADSPGTGVKLSPLPLLVFDMSTSERDLDREEVLAESNASSCDRGTPPASLVFSLVAVCVCLLVSMSLHVFARFRKHCAKK